MVERHPIMAIIVGALLSAFGASVGFNVSQVAIVSQVKINSQSISDLRAKEETDILNLTVLFQKNLDAQRELIDLVKVQNELIERRK